MKNVYGKNLTPINKLAARQLSRGEHYESGVNYRGLESDVPLPIRAVNFQESRNPSFDDFTGRKFGRLTVIGMYADGAGKWVCRCSCGSYLVRSSKAIKNQQNIHDACSECRHLMHLKRNEHWRRTGKEVGYEEYI